MAKENNHNKEVECEAVEVENLSTEDMDGAENSAQESDNVADEASSSADNVADVTDWRDKYLRLSAEFDNYRKRTLREKMDIIAAGGEDVIKSLLPVLDDMDRAMAAIQNAADIDALRQGVELITHKLNDTLKARGVEQIEALGQTLDTDLHEAVARFPKEGATGQVIDIVQKGYRLKDKVLRHAKVVVGE